MIQAVVKTQFKILAGMFDVGDKVNIEIVRYKEDTILSQERKVHNKQGILEVIIPATIAKKGEYKYYRVKSKNGHYYSENCFQSYIGYKSLGDIFENVN